MSLGTQSCGLWTAGGGSFAPTGPEYCKATEPRVANECSYRKKSSPVIVDMDPRPFRRRWLKEMLSIYMYISKRLPTSARSSVFIRVMSKSIICYLPSLDEYIGWSVSVFPSFKPCVHQPSDARHVKPKTHKLPCLTVRPVQHSRASLARPSLSRQWTAKARSPGGLC